MGTGSRGDGGLLHAFLSFSFWMSSTSVDSGAAQPRNRLIFHNACWVLRIAFPPVTLHVARAVCLGTGIRITTPHGKLLVEKHDRILTFLPSASSSSFTIGITLKARWPP